MLSVERNRETLRKKMGCASWFLCVGSAGYSTCSFSSTQVLQCIMISSASSICTADWLRYSGASIFPLSFLRPFCSPVPPVSELPLHEFSHILEGAFQASSMGRTSRKFCQCSITEGLAIQWAKAMSSPTRSGSQSGAGLFSISSLGVMATSYYLLCLHSWDLFTSPSQSPDTLIPCDN